jgi:hypothetical protein
MYFKALHAAKAQCNVHQPPTVLPWEKADIDMSAIKYITISNQPPRQKGKYEGTVVREEMVVVSRT